MKLTEARREDRDGRGRHGDRRAEAERSGPPLDRPDRGWPGVRRRRRRLDARCAGDARPCSTGNSPARAISSRRSRPRRSRRSSSPSAPGHPTRSPQGFGALVPRTERIRSLGVLYPASLFTGARAVGSRAHDVVPRRRARPGGRLPSRRGARRARPPRGPAAPPVPDRGSRTALDHALAEGDPAASARAPPDDGGAGRRPRRSRARRRGRRDPRPDRRLAGRHRARRTHRPRGYHWRAL